MQVIDRSVNEDLKSIWRLCVPIFSQAEKLPLGLFSIQI
jgi:hypothetical protein